MHDAGPSRRGSPDVGDDDDDGDDGGDYEDGAESLFPPPFYFFDCIDDRIMDIF